MLNWIKPIWELLALRLYASPHLHMRARACLQEPPVHTELGAGPLEQPEPTPEQITRHVLRAARFVPGTKCLARSIVLCEALRKAGWPAQMRIGVRALNQAFGAHAWVELQGQVLGDDAAAIQAFRVMESPRFDYPFDP